MKKNKKVRIFVYGFYLFCGRMFGINTNKCRWFKILYHRLWYYINEEFVLEQRFLNRDKLRMLDKKYKDEHRDEINKKKRERPALNREEDNEKSKVRGKKYWDLYKDEINKNRREKRRLERENECKVSSK